MKFLPILSSGLLPAAATCSAAIVDIPALKDATLYESSTGALANGAGDFFFAGRTLQAAGASLRRGLIEFDILSSIPAGSIINSAELTLHASFSRATNTVISLHLLTREWNEGTTNAAGLEGSGGAPVTGNDVTWTHAVSPGTAWSAPGAAGDFSLLGSSSQTISVLNALYTWTGLQNDVQSWLNNDATNHGWLLLGDESASATSVQFGSRTNPNEDSHPLLRVDYTVVPEPAVAGFAAAAVTAAVRRRRRN
jgi:hypothetical protein